VIERWTAALATCPERAAPIASIRASSEILAKTQGATPALFTQLDTRRMAKLIG